MRYVLKRFLLFMLIFIFIVFSLPLLVLNLDKSFSKEVYLNSKEEIMVKLYRHDKDKVEEINLEKYLEGVLAAEMPATFDIEALKAQAVASRTYALSKIINKQKVHDIADVCDTVHSQAYIDEKDYDNKFGGKKDEYISKIKQAIEDTRGEVLIYNGEIVKNALYFAVSSGVTEEASEVFSFSEPYLQSVNSEFDQDAPNAYKEYVFSEKEFLKKINNKYKDADVDSFEDVKILEYTTSGSIGKIKLGEEVVRGLDFRYLFGVNSSNINMEKDGENIIFKVKGYGHGVGLSQWGAGKMAKLGYTYDEILKHYYSGVEIEDGYSL